MLNFNRKDLRIAKEREKRIDRGASQPNMSTADMKGDISGRRKNLNLNLSDLSRGGKGSIIKSEVVNTCLNRSVNAVAASGYQSRNQPTSVSDRGSSRTSKISSNNDSGKSNDKDTGTTEGNGNGKGKVVKLKSKSLNALVRDKVLTDFVPLRKASHQRRSNQQHYSEAHEGGNDDNGDRDREKDRGVKMDRHMSHPNVTLQINRNDYRTAVRSDLAAVDRKIRIYNINVDHRRMTSGNVASPDVCTTPGDSTCCFTPRQSDCRSFHTAQAKLFCWVLAQRKTLLVRAELPDSFPVIGVEAEVSVRDLAAARGLDVDALLIDPELERIAREIIEEAELTVEDREVSRLGGSKSSEAFDASHLKQRIGQVVSIVVHLSRAGNPSQKHHSTSQAFVDALSHMERAGEGTWTPRIGQCGTFFEPIGTYVRTYLRTRSTVCVILQFMCVAIE